MSSRWIIIIVVSLVILFFLMRWLVVRVSPMPPNLGVDNGRLAPCPSSPNCVSTFEPESDRLHQIAPIAYDSDTAVAYQKMRQIIESMPRSTIITTNPTYIHAEFRSLTWAFIDDVEIFFDEENNTIHFRAAARLGQEDFKANRNRMEEIRAAFLN